jgi:hypothetical protein
MSNSARSPHAHATSPNLLIPYRRIDGGTAHVCPTALLRSHLDGNTTPATARLWFGRGARDGCILVALEGRKWVLFFAGPLEVYNSFGEPSPFGPSGDYAARELTASEAATWLEANGDPMPHSLHGIELADAATAPAGSGGRGIVARTVPGDTEVTRVRAREDKERLVREYLAKHPQATSAQVARATGIQEGTIRGLDAWKAIHSPQAARLPARPRSHERPLTDKMLASVASPSPRPDDEATFWLDLESEFKRRCTLEELEVYDRAADSDAKQDILVDWHHQEQHTDD